MSGGRNGLTGSSPADKKKDNPDENRTTKGDRTRLRILSVTEELLSEKPVWELRSVDITRRARLAPATFYSHFDSVTQAVLELVEGLSESTPTIEALAMQPWRDVSQARAFVTAHLDHWSQHRTVFRIRDHTADSGDLRFQLAKYRSIDPLLRTFSVRFKEAQDAGRFPATLDPAAMAGLFIAMLEQAAAVLPRVEAKGLSPIAIPIEASALIDATVFIAFSLFGAEGVEEAQGLGSNPKRLIKADTRRSIGLRRRKYGKKKT